MKPTIVVPQRRSVPEVPEAMIVWAEGRSWHSDRDLGLEYIGNGAAKTCYLLEGGKWVLKVGGSYDSIMDELVFMDEMSGIGFGLHFPFTIKLADTVVLQEYCPINKPKYWANFKELIALGHAMGIHDLHEENIGWRGNIPVFIDLDSIRHIPEEKSKELIPEAYRNLLH